MSPPPSPSRSFSNTTLTHAVAGWVPGPLLLPFLAGALQYARRHTYVYKSLYNPGPGCRPSESHPLPQTPVAPAAAMPAPYSDNMYSDMGQDASDDERDALSPTDGYFHASASSDAASSSALGRQPDQQHQRTSSNVPSVPNVLVEDPTLRDQGAKAREAEQERQINNAADHHHTTASSPYPPQLSSTSSYHPTPSASAASPRQEPGSPAANPSSPSFVPSHHHRRSVEEDEPVQFPGDRQSQGYQTFASLSANARTGSDGGNMGVPEEQQALLPRHPESMGGNPNGPPHSRWQRLKDSMSSPNLRPKIKTILGVLLIFSIIFAIFGGITITSSSSHKNPKFIDKDPVREPDMGGDSDMEWKPSYGCRNTPHVFDKRTTSIGFGGERKLQVTQTIDKNDRPRNGRMPQVFGQLIVRPAGDDKSEGTIDLEVISNDANLGVEVHADLEGNDQLFKMITPHALDWWSQSGDGPCIQMRVTLWVPRKSFLRNLAIDAIQLDISLLDGLVLGVSDSTAISTISGDFRASLSKDVNDDVVPYTLESRKTYIKTTSGNIRGWFPLYDLLKISSASGDITTQVSPKPADKKSPESAVLDVGSISGQVKITEPLAAAIKGGKPSNKLPARDYVIKVATASGDIEVEAATSSSGTFASTSGNFDLKLLPVLEKDLQKSESKPQLSTDTKSGDSRITILEPLWTSTSGTRMYPPGRAAPGSDVFLPPVDVPLPPYVDDGNDAADEPRKNPEKSHKGPDDALIIIHPHTASEIKARKVDDGKTRAPLSVLEAKHSSISGDARLFYPASWSGHFHLQSISGNTVVRGDGIEIIRRSRGIMKVVEGRKGDGESDIKVESMSGDMELVVGKGDNAW
ncbi:ankyrin repeat-containing protein [Purpureocillium lavendulum]|uniref:Ankyrin repeat-containing protein n=1 Tax=Purpureocillium lavendulum TaxID=1247861 RepID=A0AB34FRL0_9HYPO|nr:ankyrin repeat-containing protein [Purpureocillium lavendulum]